MYKEFAYTNNGSFVRNILEDEKYFHEFYEKHSETDCYCTYASYDIKDQDSAKIKAPFVLDIDNEKDLVAAHDETKKLYSLLKKIGVSAYIYFSGAKGFHLIIPFDTFGVEPSYHLIDVYKNLALGLIRKNRFKDIDTKIYERKRVFRINNTKNTKTGLYKIALTGDELESLTIDDIKKLAKTKRDIKIEKIEEKGFLEDYYRQAETIYLKSLERKNEHRSVGISEVKMYPCVKKLLEDGAVDGDRNDSCYTLSLFLKSQNLSEDDALKTLHGFSGLSDSEVSRTVKSAYKSTHKFGCNDNELVQKYCDKEHCKLGYARKGLSDLIWDKEDLMGDIKKDLRGEFDSNITMGCDDLDNRWGKTKKEELMVCAADSGMGKSAYAFWFMKQNIARGNKILFCSLEMATRSLITRSCKEMGMSIDDIKDLVMSPNLYFYKDGEKLSTKNLRKNLEVSIQQDMGIDAIVIDHLGYIEKEADNIYESFTSIVEELSNFSKDLCIPILLLTHFNKGSAGASDKPRAVNDILGTGRIRDLTSKLFQIWYSKENKDGVTAFILQKGRFVPESTVKLKYTKGGYESITKSWDEL